jgi:hypothetical protein
MEKGLSCYIFHSVRLILDEIAQGHLIAGDRQNCHVMIFHRLLWWWSDGYSAARDALADKRGRRSFIRSATV